MSLWKSGTRPHLRCSSLIVGAGVGPWEKAWAGVKTGTQLLQDLEARSLKRPLLTRIAALDNLPEGGIARGTLVELAGRRSSGRFALGLAALAAVTQSGESAALIDLGDHLDPDNAAAAGVDLARLLWLRPSRLLEAAASAEMILATGFDLVVLDLGVKPFTPRRPPESVWIRLARAAQAHEAVLLVISPFPLKSSASHTVIAVHDAKPLWSGVGAAPRLLAGLSVRLSVRGRRGGERSGTLSFFTREDLGR
jgi:hypothetical protein